MSICGLDLLLGGLEELACSATSEWRYEVE